MNGPLLQDQTIDSPAWSGAAPDLSVAVPFFRYDPSPLIERLETMARPLGGAVELIFLEDGGGVPELIAPAADRVARLEAPAKLVALAHNLGRAQGRNRLFAEARARHVLFLDCDMAPDRDDFLKIWLDLATQDDPPVAVGGFSLIQIRPTTATRLHYALQARGECAPVEVRARQPEKYVFTSNLLVRRDVFLAEPFDSRFAGWGWEDVEWGARISRTFGIVHIDNTATHLGLDDAPALLRKYAQSGENFARMVACHADIVRTYPSYRVARALSPLPFKTLGAALCRRIALSPAPLMVRILASKFYRAFLYAAALTSNGEEILY